MNLRKMKWKILGTIFKMNKTTFQNIPSPYSHILWSMDDYQKYDEHNKQLFKNYIVNNFDYEHYINFSEILENYTLSEYIELNCWLTQQFNKKFDIHYIIDKEHTYTNPLDNLLLFIKRYNLNKERKSKITERIANSLNRYYKRKISYALHQLKSQNDLNKKLNFIDSLSVLYYDTDNKKAYLELNRNIQLAKDKYGKGYMNELIPLLDLIKSKSSINYIPLIKVDIRGNLSLKKRRTFEELYELCYNNKYDPSKTIIKKENILPKAKVINDSNKLKKAIHYFFKDCNAKGITNNIDEAKINIFYNSLINENVDYFEAFQLKVELIDFFKKNNLSIRQAFLETFIYIVNSGYINHHPYLLGKVLSDYFKGVIGLGDKTITVKLSNKKPNIHLSQEYISFIKNI